MSNTMLPATTTAAVSQQQQQSPPISGGAAVGGGSSNYYAARPSLSDGNNAIAAPFTELPPPLSQNNDFHHAINTATTKEVPSYYGPYNHTDSKYKLFTAAANTITDPLLSPSPSPTPSPPTTLPLLLSQPMMPATTTDNRYHYYDAAGVTSTTNSGDLMDNHRHYNSYRHNRSANTTSAFDHY